MDPDPTIVRTRVILKGLATQYNGTEVQWAEILPAKIVAITKLEAAVHVKRLPASSHAVIDFKSTNKNEKEVAAAKLISFLCGKEICGQQIVATYDIAYGAEGPRRDISKELERAKALAEVARRKNEIERKRKAIEERKRQMELIARLREEVEREKAAAEERKLRLELEKYNKRSLMKERLLAQIEKAKEEKVKRRVLRGREELLKKKEHADKLEEAIREDEGALAALGVVMDALGTFDDPHGWLPTETGTIITYRLVGEPTGGEIRLEPGPKAEVPCILRAAPFNKGANRFAYLAKVGRENIVAKTFFSPKPARDFESDILCLLVARWYADRYNAAKGSGKPIRFLEPRLLYVKSKNLYYALETKLPSFERFTNNNGYISEKRNNSVYAFGHFTWHISSQKVMITDLQGCKHGHEYTLTDPAVHSLAYRRSFGATNLGDAGVIKFFESHRCNHVCQSLRCAPHEKQTLAFDSSRTY